MARQNRYKLQTACPQCGCSSVEHVSHEEMMKRFGDVPNIELECSECMARYTADRKTVCPEWDAECRQRDSQ